MIDYKRIKKEVMARIGRGHIDVTLTLSGTETASARMSANLPLARQYFNCLNDINRELNLDTAPSLAMISAYPEVITLEEADEDMDAVWLEIKAALSAALTEAEHMREEEGQSLKADLLARVALIDKTVNSIEGAIPDLVRQKEAALQERLQKLLKGIDLDPMRLAQEVAIIADKSDITEELVRLKSHIQQFNSFMELDEPVGRRLDFLLQEFLREINTMASKINNPEITHKTVELKNEVEKMREQAANIE